MTSRPRLLARLPYLMLLLAGCAESPAAPETDASTRVARVAVAPANLSLDVGATARLTATPLDAAGATLPGVPVAWSSTDTTVATVSPAGLVSARAAGATTIRATSEGRSGGVTVTVLAPPVEEVRQVAWIQILPAGGLLPQAIGTSRQLGVVAWAADGTEITGRAVTWATSVASVASVSAAGVLQAHAAGTTWVKAEVDGRRDSVIVSVPTLIARIETDVAELALGVGELRTIVAVARDAHGVALARPFVWSTGNGAVATVDATGRVEARGAGTTLVTVTSEGRSATVRVTVVGRQWRLSSAGGRPLPADLDTTMVTVGGETRAARFQATEGTLRMVRDRYELRLEGWLLVDGAAPLRTTRASAGVVAYDVVTGEALLFEGDDWQGRQPRFRARFRENGGLELDWSREPGAAIVTLGFTP